MVPHLPQVTDRAMQQVASVFLPVMRSWRETAAHYSDEELALIVGYYARMEEILREHVTRLKNLPSA